MNHRRLSGLLIVFAVGVLLALVGAGVWALQMPPAALADVPGLQQGTPRSISAATTADALRDTDIPGRDLTLIVPSLRKNLALLTPEPTPVARVRKLGDSDTFYVVENASTGSYRTVTATIRAIVPHAYFWVENGMNVDQAQLQRSAEFFEQSIYPTNHKFFGNEKSPGPDGDVHIHILNTRFQDAAGYFSSQDTYPKNIVPYSNQKNIIYMNVEALKPGTDEYNGDIAHEFQHLIHSYEAEHKTGWIDEGMADLAIKENGFDVGGVLNLFARNPDTQLNTWSNEPQSSLAHYAASYLFFNYGAGRFGPDLTRQIIHAPHEGINGIEAVLAQRTPPIKFDELFADWAATNYINDPKVENGRLAYTNEKNFRILNEPVLSQFPMSRTAQMRQYAANYFGLQSNASTNVTVYFTGTTTAKLLPVDAHGGQWVWYSNRADLADMSLTREVNLSQVTKATLQFWTWYDIEKNFDYGYVQVSTDGGRTWDIVPGKHTSTENPNGASYGPAYTGRSGAVGDSAQPQWIQDERDLSPYAGKTVLLRFQYLTDDAYNAPGWAIDDIAIPEIGFADSVEESTGGWQVAGFIRSDNRLPQRFIVQVVQQGATTTVSRVTLDSQNRGNIAISGLGKDLKRAELIITAHAPTTTERAQYEFSVVPR